MNDQVTQIADAILYEGYILYPYRPSALKNRQRWNFGVLYPPAYAAAQDGTDTSEFRCQCLVRGARISVTVRFLHLVTRVRRDAEGNLIETWQEALAREFEMPQQGRLRLAFEGAEDREDAQTVRRREPLRASIEFRLRPAGSGDWLRADVRIANCENFRNPCGSTHGWNVRERALRRSLVSTHAILRVKDGEFASLIDPPEHLRQASASCVNQGLFPVLAGTDSMLASPIILYDQPQIAPESAGPLFDGTEIDEILSLRLLALTDEEKRELAESDINARRILERTESLSQEQWMGMHGALRDVPGPERAG